MARDTWTARELPVLDYVVGRLDDAPDAWMQVADLEAVVGSRAAAIAAVRALTDDEEPYLTGQDASTLGGFDYLIQGVTARARRAVRSWPTPDSAAAQLIEALERSVEEAASPEERTKRQKALDAVRGLPQAVVAGVMSTIIGGAITGG